MQKKLTDFKEDKPKFSKSLLSIKKNTFLHSVYYKLIENPFIYRYKKRLKYGAVSLIGEIADILVLFILTNFLGFYYILSAIISYSCAIFVNFNLNKTFTFKFKHKCVKEYITSLIKYLLVSLGGMIINISLLAFVVELFNLNYLISKIIVNLVVFIFIYKGHSFILKIKKN